MALALAREIANRSRDGNGQATARGVETVAVAMTVVVKARWKPDARAALATTP
jgi:hypothetical protein